MKGNTGPAAFFNLIGTVVERFGWPGCLLVFFLYFLQTYATNEQKTRIIEMYVLGQGVGGAWPMIVLCLLFAAAFVAQNMYFQRKLKSMDRRLTEVADEKSKVQERAVGKSLKHGKRKGAD
jgi:uncharacterized membrane protein (DUF485 family)